jgi:hypothetical protein
MRVHRFAAVAAVLVVTPLLLASACNIFADYGNAICRNDPAGCPAGGGTGGTTPDVPCGDMPGFSMWGCNVDSALGTPLPGVPPPPQGTCGVVFCATDATSAAQQAAGLAGVSGTDPRLRCLSLGGSVISLLLNEPTVTNTFNAPGAVCVPKCTACADGQGSPLQNVGEHCGSTGPYCCQGLTCEGYGSTWMGQCVGTIQCPSQIPPALVGLTTTRLRQIATLNKINGCDTQTGVTQSRTIGLAFENWVLVTMGQTPRNTKSFTSQLRKNRTGGLPASVIPEFVGNLNTWFPAQGWSFPTNNMFFEVKAVTGVLTLSTSNWQILGLIDVASGSFAADAGAHPPAALVFTTTGNTNLDIMMLQQATQLGVAVWQQIVMEDTNSDPNNPDLYIDQVLPANQDVYNGAVPLPMHQPWRHSPLTSPTSPPMPVPGDPDPPEVD